MQTLPRTTCRCTPILQKTPEGSSSNHSTLTLLSMRLKHFNRSDNYGGHTYWLVVDINRTDPPNLF